jgi:ribonuclease BN (tRNA processing enzyme)
MKSSGKNFIMLKFYKKIDNYKYNIIIINFMEYYDFWKKELSLDNIYKLKGFSRGSLRTGFILLPHNIFLDAGVPTFIKPAAIILTHGHQDHIDSLYTHLLDNPNKIPVIASYKLLNNLQSYLSANRSVNAGFKIKFTNWLQIPVYCTSKIEINNIKFYIEAIPLDHEVECYGYGINEIRYKLKEEYLNCKPDELKEIKKTKEITEEKYYSILFFCGDMNYTSLKNLPFSNYPYFIIECTFLEDEHLNEAREKMHLHITDLIPYFTIYDKTKFILIHFSCRYNKSKIKEFATKYSYPNVIYWL